LAAAAAITAVALFAIDWGDGGERRHVAFTLGGRGVGLRGEL
jgi:hypothetical protein